MQAGLRLGEVWKLPKAMQLLRAEGAGNPCHGPLCDLERVHVLSGPSFLLLQTDSTKPQPRFLGPLRGSVATDGYQYRFGGKAVWVEAPETVSKLGVIAASPPCCL